MRRYWVQIVLGAIVVFGLGMGAVTVIRGGKARVETALAAMPTIMASIPERLDPFRVDGVATSPVTRVQLLREAGHAERQMLITLAESDSAAARLGTCDALFGSIDSVFEGGMRCGSADSTDGYDDFGTLAIQGSDITIPLYASIEDVSEFDSDEHGEMGQNVDITADSAGRTAVRVTDATGNDRVRIIADSGGATIEVRSPRGERVFRLDADSTGVRFNRDPQE
jgi:hypothetical protein